MTASQPIDKRRARSERTRLTLLEAAMACYKRNGVSKTGMDEVAQEAGVGRATLYRHFNNQESLLSDVMAHTFSQIQAVIAASVQSCRSAEDIYVETALILIRESDERGMTALLFGEDSATPAVSRISFSDPAIIRMGEEMLAPFLERAKKEGILRDWVTRPLLLEWTSRLMLSFMATPGERLDSPAKLRRFFHQAVVPSIIKRP